MDLKKKRGFYRDQQSSFYLSIIKSKTWPSAGAASRMSAPFKMDIFCSAEEMRKKAQAGQKMDSCTY